MIQRGEKPDRWHSKAMSFADVLTDREEERLVTLS